MQGFWRQSSCAFFDRSDFSRVRQPRSKVCTHSQREPSAPPMLI